MNSRTDIAQIKARLDRVESQLGIRANATASRPPFYGLTPSSGLHLLKDAWYQVASMRPQCSWLCEELDAALEATRNLAPDRPRRNLGFELARRLQQQRPQNGEERQLEWDVYDCLGLKPDSQDGGHRCIKRVVGFQVPLYDNRLHNGWDKIDLVSIGQDGCPAIVEVKRGSSSEKPLRPILEAAGYAVALKKVWKVFRQEVQELLDDTDINIKVDMEPSKFHVVVLAPSEYWATWNACKAITQEHWQDLGELVEAFRKRGFPFSFVEISQGPPNMQLCDAKLQL